MTETKQTLTIDGKDYNVADLSDRAKQQIANLRAADEEIERLNRQLAIARTARVTYGRALAEELPSVDH